MNYDSFYPSSRTSVASSSTRGTRGSPDHTQTLGYQTLSSVQTSNPYLVQNPSTYTYRCPTGDMRSQKGINFPCTINSTAHFSGHYNPRQDHSFLRPTMVKTSDSHPMISPQLNERLLQLADRSRRLGVHRYSRSRNALIRNEMVASRKSPPPLTSTISNRFFTPGPTKAPVVSQTYRPYRE
jgi:hypothetical protein